MRVVLLSIGVMILGGCAGDAPRESERELVLFCAAGLRPPVAATIDDFGEAVLPHYGGSGELLAQLELRPRGDLYLAADASYIERARERGLVAESLPLATLRPVIVVARGNPLGIEGVTDLFHENVRVSLANPETAAVGRLTRRALTEAGTWDALAAHARVFKPTVTEVAQDVALSTVDAGIVWDATARQWSALETVAVPELDAVSMQVTIGVLTKSEQPARALRFARFLSAPSRGAQRFEAQGYEALPGDVWEERPEIVLYSGSMLRPAVDDTITAFEEREGVIIHRKYDGCGILTAQMRTGETPEAYLSCDLSFMEMVEDRFLPSVTLSENDMVILVQRGNPHEITGARDLTREGLRLGLAHPEKSALGALTHRALEEVDLYRAVAANVIVDAPTGDMLVNQIRVGSLDAVIVYRSNARATPANLEQHLDLVELGLPLSTAIQPAAIARSSEHQLLLGRLLEQLQTASSRDRFLSYGFRWVAGESTTTRDDGE